MLPPGICNNSTELSMQLQPLPRLPLTTFEMMKQSIPFKICFALAIASVVTVLALTPASTIATCSKYRSCSWWYGSNYYECQYYSSTYCCNNSYSTSCGGSYCYYKPSSYEPCWGIFITMWVCSALAFFLSIAVIIMWCNFKRRAQNPFLNPGANYVQVIDPRQYNEQPFYSYNNVNNPV